MEPWIITISVAAVTMAVLAWFYYDRRRSARLQKHFGQEYGRMVAGIGSRRGGESELERRKALARELRTRPLNLSDRERFLVDWQRCQSRFVDDPGGAVNAADALLLEVLRTRGYSAGNPSERMIDIAAAYPRHAEQYREAGEILARYHQGEASTADLRKAFLDYRTLFDDLLGDYDEELKRAS